MHACMHAYIHTYIHTYIHYMHACIHTCMHTCIHACMHTCMHTCVHATRLKMWAHRSAHRALRNITLRCIALCDVTLRRVASRCGAVWYCMDAVWCGILVLVSVSSMYTYIYIYIYLYLYLCLLLHCMPLYIVAIHVQARERWFPSDACLISGHFVGKLQLCASTQKQP